MTDANVKSLSERSFCSEGERLKVRGFMCMTAWEYESGHASGGNRIFWSLEDVLKSMRCAKACGVVEVEVTIVGCPIEGTGE